MTEKKRKLPGILEEAVLGKSDDSSIDKSKVVKGYDFNNGLDYDALFKHYIHTGFQATNIGRAIEIINKMLDCKPRCKIFLGFTSNMISCGVREIIRYLCEHRLVDCIVTTAGGIEEDIMKCLADTYVGKFTLKGKELREKGINRIGNLLVPNDNYVKFEEWMKPIIHSMHDEQEKSNVFFTPSKIIARLGKEINNKESVLYWAWKNEIPIYCPAITDGAVGDNLFFYSYERSGFIVDICKDICSMNEETLFQKKTGMIILGGGVQKHHILNANLMRNGAEYSVFINTAQEFDGSDAGARPDEAISWGKIKIDSEATKVYADASIVFPIVVGQTFVKFVEKNNLQNGIREKPKERNYEEEGEEEEKKEEVGK